MSFYKHCIMILADGARADVMQKLLQEGKLPALGELVASGGSFRTATTVFPSTTGPAYLPYLTGCFPGTCNVPGIRWFDKNCYHSRPYSKDRFRSYVGAESFYLNGDVSRAHKTLFEIISRSVNIFSSINRGVSFRGDHTKFSRIWYWYYAHLTDRWGLVDEAAERKILKALNDRPEFLFVVFPGIDEFSHLSSPFHSRTFQAYQDLDRAVGNIRQRLKKEGLLEETVFFIVSDHGLSETTTHLPLNQFLEGMGIRTLYYPKIFKTGFQAASMVSGNAMSHLYFKGENWCGRTFWESLVQRKDRIIDKLLERQEVDLLAAQRENGTIVVKNRLGEAIIQEKQHEGKSRIYYKAMGRDPFEYPDLPELMTDRESLDRTASSLYPDALVQLLQIFRSPRTGDVVLSARKGFDLRLRHEIHEHKSSHGSLFWEHMNVPVVTNARLKEGPLRSVDIFPSVLELLRRPVPASIDGISAL